MIKRKRVQGPDFSKLKDRMAKFLNGKWKYYLFFTCFGIVERFKAQNSDVYDQNKYDEVKTMLYNLQLELDVRVFDLCERIINIVLVHFNATGKVDIRGIWMKALIIRIAYIYAEQLISMDSFFGFQLDIETAHTLFPNVQPLKDRFEEVVKKYDQTLNQSYSLENEVKLIHELLDIGRETYIVTAFSI